MKRNSEALPRENRTNRRWAVGALMALTMLGAVAAAGAVGGKPSSGIIGPELPAEFSQSNRISIEDITGPGEWIEVLSFSWGVTQTGDLSGGGGGGAGKASFQDLHFTTHLSPASPQMAKAVVSGEHIKKVVFHDFTAATKKGNETVYLKITLSDCLITSYQVSGNSGSDALPMESISIAFAKIEFAYVGGDSALSNSFTYDLKAGKF
jgi:type VI secretion system secreted protein Hcp